MSNGAAAQGAADYLLQTINEPTTIVWRWELDYAVFVDYTTTKGTRPPVVLGNPIPEQGVHWVPKDSQFSSTVDRIAGGDVFGGDSNGHRYLAKEYEVENLRGPEPGAEADTYWKFSEATGGGLTQPLMDKGRKLDGFTVAWWGKIDRKLDSKRDEVFLELFPNGSSTYTGPIEDRDNERRLLDSMTIGVRPDGQFFVEEAVKTPLVPTGEVRELASLPSALVGLEWHHWAVIIDFPEVDLPFNAGTLTYEVPFPFTTPTDLIVSKVTAAGTVSALSLGTQYNAGSDDITILPDTRIGATPGTNMAGLVGGDKIRVNLRKIKVYRDGALVFQKNVPIPLDASGVAVPATDESYKPAVLRGVQDQLGCGTSHYAVNGTGPVAEADSKHEKLEGGINNIALWFSALRPDDSSASPRVAALFTNARASGAAALGIDGGFGADIDGTAYNAVLLPFPAGARTALRTPLTGPVAADTIGNRVGTAKVTIDDWMRVRWRWDEQVRYIFDASNGQPGGTNADFNGESFVRFYNQTGTTVEDTVWGNGTNLPAWLPAGRKVEVGAFYRTLRRDQTLGNFLGNLTGDLGTMSSDISKLTDLTVSDANGRARVARIWQVPAAAKPSEVHFIYQPTVFRAVVPLGQGFDALNPNTQLIPALPDGAVLRADENGPSGGFQKLDTGPSGVGEPLRWDQLGKRSLPAHPGIFSGGWPDAKKQATAYKIEIVSGYPDDLVTNLRAIERPDGLRETSTDPVNQTPVLDFKGEQKRSPSGLPLYYVTQIRLAGTEGKFPASPVAHYRHHFGQDPGRDRSPPHTAGPQHVRQLEIHSTHLRGQARQVLGGGR